MGEKNKTTFLKRADKATQAVAKVLRDMQLKITNLEHENERLRTQHKPIVVPDGQTPITVEGLTGLGMGWSERWMAFLARTGRLTFWVRGDGTWGLAFEATRGGNIGSYRKLQSIEDVKLLMDLWGVKGSDEQ